MVTGPSECRGSEEAGLSAGSLSAIRCSTCLGVDRDRDRGDVPLFLFPDSDSDSVVWVPGTARARLSQAPLQTAKLGLRPGSSVAVRAEKDGDVR